MVGEAELEERLERLEDDVGRILASLTAVRHVTKVAELYVTQATIESGVKRELKGLELRHRIFPAAAHDQVAWAMLLAAYQHGAERKRLSVTALCSFSYAPPTTALRHLELLTDAGLLNSSPDLADRRRRWVSLSDHARGLIVRYFTALHT